MMHRAVNRPQKKSMTRLFPPLPITDDGDIVFRLSVCLSVCVLNMAFTLLIYLMKCFGKLPKFTTLVHLGQR